MMAQYRHVQQRAGFTLVEISIILLIIGLVTGGILVGQSLWKSARNKATISDLQKYATVVGLFRSRYGYAPGDFPNVAMFKPGLRSGDGSMLVTWDGEMRAAWTHMYFSGLSPFGTPAWNGSDDGTPNDKLIPPAQFPNSFYWFGAPDNSAYGNDTPRSNYFMIAGDYNDSGTLNWDGVMDSREARDIDVKMDDGVPNRGHILASGGYAEISDNCVLPNTPQVSWSGFQEYDLSNSDPECRLYYIPFDSGSYNNN